MPSSISIPKILVCVAIASLLLLAPTSLQFTPNVRVTAAVGLLMALLWLTEAVPMGLTALLPLVLFPLAGVSSAEKIAAPYANSAVFLFLGGFLVSATFERWGLHRRIAYFALHHVGTQPRRIVLAVMLVTAVISMWISNTATTLMMCPIAVAIVTSLGTRGERTAEATLLGVAYGASLGGIGTPIGTPTNLIFLGSAHELFPTAKTVSFAAWMGFGVAYLILAVPICWLILVTVTRVGKGEAIPLESLGLEKPGPMTRPQKIAVLLCSATALLWIFRADIVAGSMRIPGWSNLFSVPKSINDTTVAVVMAFLAFLLPVGNGKRLLEWEEFRRVPWDVLILFGGGFALADALESSGFSKWAGARLSFVGSWPPIAMILVVCIAVTALSEVASNVATATAMMPIAAALAVSIGVHPYLLMIPAVLAASSGFML
ncbi:MAG TPA: SLC13 family permease, partial [Thermoanaerobaculia bacterium]|nr:SLC13 family permease [Thermoanaerobaculia bacterium]